MAIWMVKYHGITKLCIMTDSTYVIIGITTCMLGCIQNKTFLSGNQVREKWMFCELLEAMKDIEI